MLEGSVLISSQNENLITLIILVIFMENEGENIPLSEEDVGKVKMILNEKLFEDFEIHRHYFLSKFGDFVSDIPRHGIGLIELKEIYEKKDKIKRGFKRKTAKGYLYTICYDESRNVFVKVGYILDESPMKIFSAIRIFRNLEKSVNRKYGLSV
ncbi:hypothetical protein J4218_05315 [Candidatus Pacearchaeota archaeon]|nr:hypothetical protein [Candidatus Pacearchaeota archaeon]